MRELGVGRTGPAVTRINIYLRRRGAGGCVEAAGRGSANESKPGLWLVLESGTHRGAGREGGDAGGRIKR